MQKADKRKKFLIIPIKNLYMNKQKIQQKYKNVIPIPARKKSLGKHKKAKFPS